MKKSICHCVLVLMLWCLGMTVYAQTSEKYDLILYTSAENDENFPAWLETAEAQTGLKIGTVQIPTDSDTRHQIVLTMLSAGDPSIDVLYINDEMATSLKNTDWIVGLNDQVMTEDILPYFEQDYIADNLTSDTGQIIGVPGYRGALSLWINQEILDLVGMEEITTREEFETFCIRCKEYGIYGYGGSWEKTYAHNEIGMFVNFFDGDYLDWTNENNRKALEFMKKMVDEGWTSVDQIVDKYEQMNQKFLDEKYGMVFNWGSGNDYQKAGMLESDKIHIADIPLFEKRCIYEDSWTYVLNAASEHQEAGIRFLNWIASPEGEESLYRYFKNYPARSDVAEEVVPPEDEIRKMYTNYKENYEIYGRPMLPQTMDFISEIGGLFQKYILDEITIDDFCEKAQNAVDRNR